MKQFAVVQVLAMVDMRTPQWNGNEAGRFSYWVPQEESSDGGTMQRSTLLFLTDTLESAQHLAKKLAEKNPGVPYMVCTGSDVFECRAAPVLKSKFTPAGLLPA
jgi:hypothetical protein